MAKTLDQQSKPPFQLERSMLKIPESDEMFYYLVWCVDYGYTDTCTFVKMHQLDTSVLCSLWYANYTSVKLIYKVSI